MQRIMVLFVLAGVLAATIGCNAQPETQKVVVIYVDQNGNPIDPPPNLNRGTPGQRTTTVTDAANPGPNGASGTNGAGGPNKTVVVAPPVPQPANPARPVVAPSPRVDRLDLATLPAAANLDSVPGPDGIKLSLWLYRVNPPQAFALEKGEIEFILYEGSIKEGEIATAEPFHSWVFTASELAQSGKKTLVGWQYNLSLNWLGHTPSTPIITLVARIPRPGEGPLYARPVHLSMAPR